MNWGFQPKREAPIPSHAYEIVHPIRRFDVALVVVIAMPLSDALTVMAMPRCNVRKVDPEPHSRYAPFIDAQ